MSADFVKVYNGFFEGSLRDTPPYARLLFLAMLSKADPDGVVLGAPSFWAAYVGITSEQVREALGILSDPDPDSTTPDLEGRRIEPWGEGANRWRIVNYRKYYEKSRNDDRAEYKRQWDREHRPSGHQRTKTNSDEHSPTQSDKSDPERKGKEKKEKNTTCSERKKPESLPEVQTYFKNHGSTQEEGEAFWLFYGSKGWKVGKSPMVDWHKAAGGWIRRWKDAGGEAAVEIPWEGGIEEQKRRALAYIERKKAEGDADFS